MKKPSAPAPKEKKIKLMLFDKGGYFKMAEYHERELFAIRSGQNWLMLTNGNTFEIVRIK